MSAAELLMVGELVTPRPPVASALRQAGGSMEVAPIPRPVVVSKGSLGSIPGDPEDAANV